MNITINDKWAVGFNEYYSPNFLNLGAWGNYASITAKYTAPSTIFGSSGVGMYVSGEFGRQWLGTSDAFYGTTVATVFGGPFPLGIPEPSYNTWNIGIGFTYKVFTLDLRYSDTDLSKGNCNAFTSDYSTTNFSPSFVTKINPRRLRLQLVRRGGYRQALGRPDGDDQPEVSDFRDRWRGRQSDLPPFVLAHALFGNAASAGRRIMRRGRSLRRPAAARLAGRSAKWSPSGASAALR